MSEPPVLVDAHLGAGPRRWGQRWIEQIKTSSTFSADAIERGRAYAVHDWQLEVHIDAGKAETTARSGPRISHAVTLTVETLSDEAFDQVLGLIAASGARTAALVEREIDLGLVDGARALGVEILPEASAITATCTCRNWGELCKHAAALASLVGDALNADPFDLFLLRGKTYPEIVARVTELREELNDGESDQATPTPTAVSSAQDAATVWQAAEAVRRHAVLPAPLGPEDAPGSIPDWGGPPPARSPFTAIGLASVARDGVDRAYDMLASGADSYLTLDRASDVARRTARAIDKGFASRLATNAALTPHELRARLAAWQTAGAPGVGVLERSVDTRRVDNDTQYRQGPDGLWFRFEKPRGRWQLTAGPFADPEDDVS